MNDTTSDIYLVFAVDEGYAPALAVAVRSLLDHLDDRSLYVYVIDKDLSHMTRSRLLASWPASMEACFLKLDTRKLKTLPLPKDRRVTHVNKSIYLRLFIPYLVPQTHHKILYLDADILAMANVMDLWQTDIEDYPVAAIQDEYVQYVSSPEGLFNHKELGLEPGVKYFNSGVLLMNLDIWRSEGLSEKIIHYIETNQSKIRLPDQDALNAVLHSRWKQLDPSWNVLIGETKKFASSFDKFDEYSLNLSAKGAKILHFVGQHKPWMPTFPHCKYRELYLSYQRRTAWS